MEKKNVVIFVAGQRFSITTADTEEYVNSIGEKVDVMIKGISKDNPRLNRDSCAILTALNFCDDETKLRQMMEVLREQVKEYINTNDALRTENSALKQELEDLRNRLDASSQKESASGITPSVPLTEIADTDEDTSEEPSVIDTPVSVPTKSESILSAAGQSRQTAFVGKDFKSDRHKNKKNKHHKHNHTQAPAAAPAPAVIPADTQTLIEDSSPYHQFSIFDDLI